MICVTTRFRLKHWWHILPMYLAYLRMRRDLRSVPGLLRYAFLIQSPAICCTLSLWASPPALTTFTNVASHVRAVRMAKVLCNEIWSAYWRLDAVSKSAGHWSGAVPLPTSVGVPVHVRRLLQLAEEEEVIP